jgi:hypothetical protein
VPPCRARSASRREDAECLKIPVFAESCVPSERSYYGTREVLSAGGEVKEYSWGGGVFNSSSATTVDFQLYDPEGVRMDLQLGRIGRYTP